MFFIKYFLILFLFQNVRRNVDYWSELETLFFITRLLDVETKKLVNISFLTLTPNLSLTLRVQSLVTILCVIFHNFLISIQDITNVEFIKYSNITIQQKYLQ